MQYGGAGGSRTRDLFHAKEARSHLRYSPMYCRPLQTLTPTRGGGYWCFTAASRGEFSSRRPAGLHRPPALCKRHFAA